jgi:hypothetical protein
MSIADIKKATTFQTFNVTDTRNYKNKFCQFTKNAYLCTCKRGEIRLPKRVLFALFH